MEHVLFSERDWWTYHMRFDWNLTWQVLIDWNFNCVFFAVDWIKAAHANHFSLGMPLFCHFIDVKQHVDVWWWWKIQNLWSQRTHVIKFRPNDPIIIQQPPDQVGPPSTNIASCSAEHFTYTTFYINYTNNEPHLISHHRAHPSRVSHWPMLLRSGHKHRVGSTHQWRRHEHRVQHRRIMLSRDCLRLALLRGGTTSSQSEYCDECEPLNMHMIPYDMIIPDQSTFDITYSIADLSRSFITRSPLWQWCDVSYCFICHIITTDVGFWHCRHGGDCSLCSCRIRQCLCHQRQERELLRGRPLFASLGTFVIKPYASWYLLHCLTTYWVNQTCLKIYWYIRRSSRLPWLLNPSTPMPFLAVPPYHTSIISGMAPFFQSDSDYLSSTTPSFLRAKSTRTTHLLFLTYLPKDMVNS